MVLLDGDLAAGQPSRGMLARLTLLTEQIERFASWTTDAANARSEKADPSTTPDRSVPVAPAPPRSTPLSRPPASAGPLLKHDDGTAPVTDQPAAPVRAGVFGWSFKRR